MIVTRSFGHPRPAELFLLILLLVPATLTKSAFADTFPCTNSTLILSAQDGNVSDPNTWMGHTVPADGDCVVIRHHVTLDQDWGTNDGTGMGWIRIENAGTLDSDCAAPHSIYFGSSGNDPVGSGTNENPGADANMFRFFVSYGTLNLSCSQPNNLAITSADDSSPWYIHHQLGDYIGCTTFSDNVCNGMRASNGGVLNLQNAASSHMGVDELYFSGIDWDMTAGLMPTNSLNLSHNYISDLYQIETGGNVSQAGNWNITFNWFDAPRPDPSAGLIYSDSGIATNWNITDNTVTNAATASYLLNAPHDAVNLHLERNAVLGSAVVQFSIAALTGQYPGSGNLINSNLCVNPEPNDATQNPCIQIGGAHNDASTTVSFNVIQGGHGGISEIGGEPLFSPTFSFNWISQWKEDSGAQGAIITRSGTVTEIYNVLVMENSSSEDYMIGNLAYTSTTGSCAATVQQDHNTIYGVSNGTGNPNLNLDWGDSSSSPHTCIVNSYARSNISYGGDLGFVNRNNYNSWNLSQGIEYGGAAVHHNLAYGASNANYQNTETSPGFDNGTIHHPSYSQYGDLTVDPMFLNPNRRPSDFDTQCGGPGTNLSLFMNLARRSGFSGAYDQCYSIPGLWRWLRLGWAPLNLQLVGAGHDGSYIGAVKPIGPGQ